MEIVIVGRRARTRYLRGPATDNGSHETHSLNAADSGAEWLAAHKRASREYLREATKEVRAATTCPVVATISHLGDRGRITTFRAETSVHDICSDACPVPRSGNSLAEN